SRGRREGAQTLTSQHFIFKQFVLEEKCVSNCLPSLTQKSASDYNNFDREFLSEKPKLSYSDKNLIESMDQSAFDGFSFINPKFEQILNK
ncbi:KPCD kinase, partial [Cnemophilus loriae]|nr:KPCD kinase [Cnemophilus loriae]